MKNWDKELAVAAKSYSRNGRIVNPHDEMAFKAGAEWAKREYQVLGERLRIAIKQALKVAKK